MDCSDSAGSLYYANRILADAQFRALMRKVEVLERDRIYCRHGIGHALDVCRIAWIRFGERNAGHLEAAQLPEYKDRIYCIGLLHDTGRCAQYETGENHAPAGARIAGEILSRIGYPADLTAEAVRIIGTHRGRLRTAELFDPAADAAPLLLSDEVELCIRHADQLARNCMLCPASDTCKWAADEKMDAIRA